MSLHDYLAGQAIEGHRFPFYALIQAALRQADSDNLTKLRRAFPEVYDDLRERYHAPGGALPEDGLASDQIECLIYSVQNAYGCHE